MTPTIRLLLIAVTGILLAGCRSFYSGKAYSVRSEGVYTNPGGIYCPRLSDQYAIDHATPVYYIDRRVFQYVRETGDQERPESRIYFQGDLDGDKVYDTALLTALNPNLYDYVLFVSLSSQPKYVMHIKVGKKGARYAESLHFNNSNIVVSGKIWAPEDAMCCPSIPFQTTYAIKDNTIIEVITEELQPTAKD